MIKPAAQIRRSYYSPKSRVCVLPCVVVSGHVLSVVQPSPFYAFVSCLKLQSGNPSKRAPSQQNRLQDHSPPQIQEPISTEMSCYVPTYLFLLAILDGVDRTNVWPAI